VKQKHLSDVISEISVTINGKELEQVQHAKVLGVYFDTHLTWAKHIDTLCSLIRSRLALLRRIRPFLTHESALFSTPVLTAT
jgi:hypothetical protein